jgi:hypothetical protein
MPDDDTVPVFFRNDLEREVFFDGEALDEEPAANGAHAHHSRRRARRPNIDKLIAKAKAAGATSVMVEGVEMRFGPGAGNGAATDVDRELAEFEARHEA